MSVQFVYPYCADTLLVLFLYLRLPLAAVLVISLAGTNLAKECLIWVKGKEIFFNTKAIVRVWHAPLGTRTPEPIQILSSV
jgi:hypothetical protein